MNIVFRSDDISPSTNYENLRKCYNVIKSIYPKSMILTCITLFSKYNSNGSVYQDTPFKNKPVNWFYNIDKFMLEYEYITKEYIASHGLFHVDHAKLSKDAQEMSILGSCNFLKTNIFCSPFNSHNDITRQICNENGIRLINDIHNWKSLEFNNFDPDHKFWYFHSWRWKPESLKKKIIIDAKLSN